MKLEDFLVTFEDLRLPALYISLGLSFITSIKCVIDIYVKHLGRVKILQNIWIFYHVRLK